jgi:hypothetical protein
VTDDSTSTPGGATAGGDAATESSDWRVTVRLRESGQAGRATERLASHKVERQVHQSLGGKVLIGTDGRDTLFLYAHAQRAAATAQDEVSRLLDADGLLADYTVERWHPIEEEWQPADVSLPQTPEEIQAERERLDAEETGESLAAGHALFEVRVQVSSHREAVALAGRLRSEGYSVARRWRFVVVGANNEDQAKEFAAKVKDEAPAGAVVGTEEVGPLLPFTAFDAAAGAGL